MLPPSSSLSLFCCAPRQPNPYFLAACIPSSPEACLMSSLPSPGDRRNRLSHSLATYIHTNTILPLLFVRLPFALVSDIFCIRTAHHTSSPSFCPFFLLPLPFFSFPFVPRHPFPFIFCGLTNRRPRINYLCAFFSFDISVSGQRGGQWPQHTFLFVPRTSLG